MGADVQVMKASLAVMMLAVMACSDAPPAGGQGSGGARDAVFAEILASPEFRQACEETPGCADPPRFDAGPTVEAVWRVLLVRESSGAIRIERIDSVSVPQGDGVPIGPLAGSHRLVGLDGGGQPVDGQLIRFPEVMRIEYRSPGPSPNDASPRNPEATAEISAWAEEVDLAGREVSTVAFVRAVPSIQSLAVQDPSGATVAQSGLPQPVARDSQPGGLGLINAALAQSAQWPYQGNIPPYCAHVLILAGEQDRALAQGIAYEDEIVELVTPGPRQLATIFSTLRHMTPMLCQGVRRISLGVVPQSEGIAGAVQTRLTGDMMLINVRDSYSESSLVQDEYRRLQMMGTIFHEAAHSTDALINAQGSVPENFTGDWILPARTLASQTIDRVRLEKGLRNEWRRFHESFRSLGWAMPHQNSEAAREAVYNWSSSQVNDAGFMSHYGATSLHDDIAEMVEWSYVTRIYLALGWTGRWSRDAACQEMRTHRERNLPSRFVTVYTKLMFLKDLGMIAEKDVKACMGPDIGPSVDTGGFHFWHDGNMLRSFDSNLTAKIGTNNAGDWIFEMQAEGEASFSQEMYPAKLQLRIGVDTAGVPLHKVAWPRGVYPLGISGNNTVRVLLDGAPAGNFDVKDGYVLVAEASNDRITGSIFVTVAMRLNAPLAVPQTWNPPLLIRFLIDH